MAATLLAAGHGGPAVGAPAAPARFLAANNDTSVPFPPSTVSIFAMRQDGSLAPPRRLSTAGNGMAGGFFGTDRLAVVSGGAQACLFASNAQSESIAAFDVATLALTGVFHGSHEDTSLARDGIGLAASGPRLYAIFSGSGNLATFQIEGRCQLTFLGDVGIRGLSGGTAQALAARGHMMVVAYGDGSVESFDLSGHLPATHNDATYAAGRDDDFVPGAVDMTGDGHFAIFGGASTTTQVQIADLSAGRLGSPMLYSLGPAWNAGSVRLSPDETVLYVSNSSGGRITAAFFDAAGGTIRPGCTSDALRGFLTKFTSIGAVAIGAGGLLYVPEFDADGDSAIGLVKFTVSPGGCLLQEVPQSPIQAGPGSALLSVAVYPPRQF